MICYRPHLVTTDHIALIFGNDEVVLNLERLLCRFAPFFSSEISLVISFAANVTYMDLHSLFNQFQKSISVHSRIDQYVMVSYITGKSFPWMFDETIMKRYLAKVQEIVKGKPLCPILIKGQTIISYLGCLIRLLLLYARPSNSLMPAKVTTLSLETMAEKVYRVNILATCVF